VFTSRFFWYHSLGKVDPKERSFFVFQGRNLNSVMAYKCSSCGAVSPEMKEKCDACGGAMVAENVPPAAPAAPAAPEQPAGPDAGTPSGN
jgi:hypothetical protein